MPTKLGLEWMSVNSAPRGGQGYGLIRLTPQTGTFSSELLWE